MDFTIICPVGNHPFTYTWNGGKGRKPVYCGPTHQNFARDQRAAARLKDAGGKVCYRCKRWTEPTDLSGTTGWCKECADAHRAEWKVRTGRRTTECRRTGCTNPKAEHPDNRLQFCQQHLDSYARDKHLRQYGITTEQFDQRLADQGGHCAMCPRIPGAKSFAVDHDHGCCKGKRSCGRCLRGILCTNCNGILGFAEDKVEILEAALDYLQRYRMSR